MNCHNGTWGQSWLLGWPAVLITALFTYLISLLSVIQFGDVAGFIVSGKKTLRNYKTFLERSSTVSTEMSRYLEGGMIPVDVS